MSSSCAPIFVGVSHPVSKIPLLSKTAKFPFQPMDYSPWSSKNLIDRNRLKKFMQVGIHVKCMHIDFGRRGLFCFRFCFFYHFNMFFSFSYLLMLQVLTNLVQS